MPQTFAFEISAVYAPIIALAGVTRDRAVVEVGGDRLLARFGFFRVETPLSNVADAVVHEEAFSPLKVIGVRYSFEDGSVTFGSSTGSMVEITFDRPVTVRPPGITRHPALWVSVADPHGLRRALAGPTA